MTTDVTAKKAKQAEQYARERWDSVEWTMGPNPWTLRISMARYFDGTQDQCWLAAAEYTRAHEQKIAEVWDEIDFLNFAFSVQDRNEDRGIVERILAREQAALDELLRGWRQQ